MEKGSKTKNIYIGMLLNKFAETLHRIRMRLGLTHIEGNLMLHIFPSVGHCIVHMYRIPNDVS